jgi:CheY-like chemotaxis protein
VLIVDDDSTLNGAMALLLNTRGYSVLSAGSGQEAIKQYREHWREIAIVLLDFQMPDLDGLEVLAQLREINSAVRALLISGHLEMFSPQQLTEPGVVAYFPKPLPIESLFEVLATAGVAPPGSVKNSG